MYSKHLFFTLNARAFKLHLQSDFERLDAHTTARKKKHFYFWSEQNELLCNNRNMTNHKPRARANIEIDQSKALSAQKLLMEI